MNRTASRCSRFIPILAAVLTQCVGCQRAEHAHEHSGHDHSGHDHPGHGSHGAQQGTHSGHGGEEAIGITRYTDQLELFAEHPPAVVGQALPFLAHLTVLQDFSALQNATVTLRLSGPASLSATVTEALRPGIFQPTITPTQAGTYQAELLVRSSTVEDAIAGFEVVVYGDLAAARAVADTSAAAAPERISFLKEQQWQVPFGTAFAVQGRLTPTVEVPGEIGTPPAGQAEVTAVVTGRVVPPDGGQLPRPGQRVKQGELLATLAPAPDTPEVAARAELAVVEAEAQLEAAQAAVSRSERLLAVQAIPARQLEQARRGLRVAEKALQSAKRTQAMFSGAVQGTSGQGSYRIAAPIGGVVTDVSVSAAHVIERGEHLLRIVDFDELWIIGHVPERDMASVVADQPAAFKLAGTAHWYPLTLTGSQATATLVHLGRVVAPLSRTLDLIYALKAPPATLAVGALLQVAVPVGLPASGVIVPRSALLDDDGRTLVFVQVEGEAFAERVVRLGPASGAHVLILAGVAVGERVVSQGANVLRLASRSVAAPAHGHVH